MTKNYSEEMLNEFRRLGWSEERIAEFIKMVEKSEQVDLRKLLDK